MKERKLSTACAPRDTGRMAEERRGGGGWRTGGEEDAGAAEEVTVTHTPAGLLFGKSGLQGSHTRSALPGDIQLRLSQWGYWGPPIHNMGPCSWPPKPGNNTAPPGNRALFSV
jgi:hypothetical protein